MSSTVFQRPMAAGALSHLEAGENQRAIREQLERILVAGLYASGTEAAGRLLTDARQMELLTGHVPPHWEKKNLQIVISTEVIDRIPGPARVLAAYSW